MISGSARRAAAGSTLGYTAQWRDGFYLSHLCMASCGSEAEVAEAEAMGYRAYLSTPQGGERIPGYLQCPYEKTKGDPLPITCSQCRACGGTSSPNTVHVQIGLHGPAQHRRLPVLQAR